MIRSHLLRTLYSEHSPFKDFPLVVCGHSLGAGVASLLSIMLHPSFPSLKAFGYCPPGAVVDDGMATYCEGFITCIARQDDLIPRISHLTLETLREEFLNVLLRMKVPKIKVFFDIRKPCPDNTAAIRNAKVLSSMDDISHDNEFYEQLEAFRAERAENNQRSGSSDNSLWIAGKILHLVDIKGDNSDYKAYVPYWASRKRDLNQIIISKRMVTDHSMMELVDILRDIHAHLNENGGVGNSISAICNSINIGEIELGKIEQDEDSDVRLFMCFSNPDGKFPIFLSSIALIALILSGLSMTMCEFFWRESEIKLDGLEILELPITIGLFSYTLLECEDGKCDGEDDKVIPSDICVPYPDNDFEVQMEEARAFAFLAMVFGSLSLLMLCVSTCWSFRRWAWIMVIFMLLLATLFQGLVFLLNQSGLCVTVEDGNVTLESKCHIDKGAIQAIAACCIYFVTAIGSMHVARMKVERPSTPLS
mmetsp:Transcript_37578/g.79239  ORF Transcript_37578/g.79239 Transcript_37578/m.79239 type:complete len:478 (+) Transcript_37578:57-1490(+)